jgi:adenylate cyclase
MVNKLNQIKSVLKPSTMSESVKKILEAEELHGAIIINRFHYITGFFFLIGATLAATEIKQVYINLVFTSAFFIMTIIHTIILKNKNLTTINIFNYIVLFTDYLLFLSLIVYYASIQSPDNFAFVLKNPILALFLMPIIMTAIQFRIHLTAFATGMLLFIFSGLLIYGLLTNVPTTNNWTEFVLGPALIIPATITQMPLISIAVALIISYTIYRAINMINRIGHIEAQKSVLSRYFSPHVVEEITANPGVINSGTHQKVTVLFSDIRGFTRLSEKMEPDAIASFLTELREISLKAIFNHGGTLDKFIGDAVMATFGTPRPSEIPGQDSRNAVLSAIEMLKSLEEFNQKRVQNRLEPIRVGIGLHTGKVFAGNLGSESRLEYTVIGDTVNTASRIESLCKNFDTEFLISEEVYNEVQNMVEVEKMEKIQVKGKEQPLQVYRVITKV